MIYECDNNGSTVWNGRTIRYYQGKNKGVPAGALDHVGSCRMISPHEVHDTMLKGAETRKQRETVVPEGDSSINYKVKEVRKMVKDMSQSELESFIEGDERVTVQRLA